MSQQITIVLVIDIQAALQSNSLKDNIYLMDTQSEDGSTGEGTESLVTAIRNGYWCDGSQVGDIVLNWMAIGVNCFPPTLPRYYSEYRHKMINRKRLQEILLNRDLLDKIPQEEVIGLLNDKKVEEIAFNHDTQLFDSENESPDNLCFLIPQISGLTGEAVDEGVIFPAQYGSPVPIKDGWYWSATVDTSKVGVYNYTLQITLYDWKNGRWIPVPMEHHASLEVLCFPQKNGFTGAGVGFLPI